MSRSSTVVLSHTPACWWCRESDTWYGSSRRRPKQIVCYCCNKSGNRVLDCALMKEAQKNIKVNDPYRVASNCSWLVDSGASDHFASSRAGVCNHRTAPRSSVEVAVKGASTTVECEGDTIVNDSNKLHGVKVVPDLQFNLISVARLTDDNWNVLFEKDRARIWNHTIGQAVEAK